MTADECVVSQASVFAADHGNGDAMPHESPLLATA